MTSGVADLAGLLITIGTITNRFMKKYLLLPVTLLCIQHLMAQTAAKTPKAIRLVDKQFNLSGTLSGESAQSFVGLEADDKIVVNCIRLSRKGSVSLSVKDYNKGTEIYKKDGFDTLRDQTIAIPAKGIYSVSLKTASLMDKDVQLLVDRIPAAHTGTVAKAAAKPLYDTASVELLNTTVHVFAKNSPQGNKTVIKISLPPNTSYWTFWIGAGKDAITKMKAFDASCSSIGAPYSTSPLVLYGMKQLSSLPMVPPNAIIGYHFMDTHNSTAFKNNQQYSFYTFKSSERITTEYSFMINHQDDLNLGITNESSNIPQDVEVRVAAFIVLPKAK